MIDALLDVHARMQEAGHGGKGAVIDDACQRLNMSRATLCRKLKEVAMRPARKRRADAGKCSLPLSEAEVISAVWMEGYRANDKKIMSMDLVLRIVRADGRARAEAVDADGVLRPLSASAVARALRHYRLHPEQLRRATPAVPMASDHPNDVWQIDASISTLFYVPDGGVADMSPAEFYKNKPGNFEKIKRQRLTRWVITDHCSGAIFVHYTAGGESIASMAEALLAAMAERPGHQMYGAPFKLMMDPGVGVTSAFRNLLRCLMIEAVINAVGNPRAKGQVEGAHNIVECDFESGFKLTHVPDIAWINAQAARWMRWYNSTRVHSRHQMTRWAKWMEITSQQLRLVDVSIARQLLTKEPVARPVNQHLQVQFDGALWSVKAVPNVMMGEKLFVTWNPLRPNAAFVIDRDADGNDVLIEIPKVEYDEHGFVQGAARIGQGYKAQPDTVLERNRNAIEQLATGTNTEADAKAARKAKAIAFAGSIDPYKHLDDVPDVIALPRRGTSLEPTVSTASAIPERIYSHFEAATDLLRRGLQLTAEHHTQIAAWHPDGVPESELDQLQHRLTVRAGLRVVGE
jgi:transposase InsO family protein